MQISRFAIWKWASRLRPRVLGLTLYPGTRRTRTTLTRSIFYSNARQSVHASLGQLMSNPVVVDIGTVIAHACEATHVSYVHFLIISSTQDNAEPLAVSPSLRVRNDTDSLRQQPGRQEQSVCRISAPYAQLLVEPDRSFIALQPVSLELDEHRRQKPLVAVLEQVNIRPDVGLQALHYPAVSDVEVEDLAEHHCRRRRLRAGKQVADPAR